MDRRTDDDDRTLHGLAIELATGAARLVRDERAAGDLLDVSAKSTSTDLVTRVDHASERWLVEQLATHRPCDGVLGEEGGERAGTTGVRWVLDPIDGTVNFVLGLPQYAVSVAAEVDGAIRAGAVCNPATAELFHARTDAGAYLVENCLDGPVPDITSGRRLAGGREVPLDRAVVGTGFAYDRSVRTRQASVAAELLGAVADIRRLGAAALDLCLVADGRLDGYYEAGLHLWDHAAGALVAVEAGISVHEHRDERTGTTLHVAARPELLTELDALLIRLDGGAVFRPEA